MEEIRDVHHHRVAPPKSFAAPRGLARTWKLVEGKLAARNGRGSGTEIELTVPTWMACSKLPCFGPLNVFGKELEEGIPGGGTTKEVV